MDRADRWRRLAVVDVEGNGQRPPDIVEIAVVPVDDGRVGEFRSWLVRPRRPISSYVTHNVHGISDDDVADAPEWSDIAHEVTEALADRVLVAHNANVEQKVLARQLPDFEPVLVVDTLRMARELWPGLEGYGLDALLAAKGIRVTDRYGQRHRAGYDAYATAMLLLQLADTAGDLGAFVDRAAPDDVQPGELW